MAYSTISKPSLHFNTKLYTGNGSTQSITGVGFQPDFCWNKNRSSATSHQLFDSVRGATKRIYSDSNAAEDTNTNSLTSFDSDGFSVGSGSSANGNGNNIVSWNWKANGAGSANTDGTINSTVSVNTTAGFSIVSYTGNGTTGATVGHGLGVKPNMIILKYRNAGSTNWQVYHSSLGATKYLQLNSTGTSTTSNTRWNDTEPTNQVFTLGSSGDVKTNGGQYIAYCFAEKTGYSKFGSWVGNNNVDGTFIYTGFSPKFILWKNISSAYGWYMMDAKRDIDNPAEKYIYAHLADAEGTNTFFDFVSNGFKIRSTGAGHNSSSNTYIYMAFAEEPLVANVGSSIPATAR